MRKLRGCTLILVVIIVAPVLLIHGYLALNGDYLAPTIPHYPNVVGDAHYPRRLEVMYLGEAFGGFKTTDSYDTVREYYDVRLAEQGWEQRWYKNRAGRCYVLLIILNSPAYTDPRYTSTVIASCRPGA